MHIVSNPNYNKSNKKQTEIHMQKVTFYHAGCPVCVGAESDVLELVDRNKFDLEVVHIGENKARIPEAEQVGVKSVPAVLMPNGDVLHINYGASMADVKGS